MLVRIPGRRRGEGPPRGGLRPGWLGGQGLSCVAAIWKVVCGVGGSMPEHNGEHTTAHTDV